MAGILDTALSGLNVFKRAMDVTSHNIANVNTEGYSKQRVELAATRPDFFGGEYIGTGVSAGNIARSYDQFITGQLRSSTTALGEANTYKEYALQVDSLLSEPSTGLSSVAQDFFNSVSDVANDPTAIANREVMLQEANALTSRFSLVDERFGEIRRQVNADVEGMTSSVNSYIEFVGELNAEISSTRGQNDLLDKRDQTLKKLSELMDISVVSTQGSDMVSVILKNGLALVVGDKVSTLSTKASETDSENLGIIFTDAGGQEQDVTNQISSGKMAGAFRFRDEILDPAQQALGTTAAGIAMEFNAQHKVGFDLDGNTGVELFSFQGSEEISAQPLNSNTGNAALTVTYNDITTDPTAASSSDLRSSDYTLEYDGTDFSLTSVKDESSIILQRTTVGGVDILEPSVAGEQLPGIRIEITGTPVGSAAAQDEFYIRPTYEAARLLEVNITDGRQIAAGTTIGSIGDNTNALQLADLANNKNLFGGSQSYQDVYAGLVSEVGGKSRIANISAATQETLWTNANGARESLSGVNLDEEAANLIKYQQSYQAAAQAISVASSMFDALLGAVR